MPIKHRRRQHGRLPLQVFPKEEWEPLWRELNRLQAEGKPTVVHKRLRVRQLDPGCPLAERPRMQLQPRLFARPQVLPNAFQGIDGGYEAEVLFSIPADAAAWEARLPAETQVGGPLEQRATTRPHPRRTIIAAHHGRAACYGPVSPPVQAWLAQQRAAKGSANPLLCPACYRDFPAISTAVTSVPPGIVNMLGQFQTWRLLEAEPTIRTFMAAVAAAGVP
jgi:hypothetical protein